MLSDAQIERWSRQILVPEIGGRGQARLCAAVVEVVGAPALAALLIERAGPRVTVSEAPSAAADVVVRWMSGASHVRACAPSPRGLDASASRAPTPTILVAARTTDAIVTAVATSPCAACVALAAPADAAATPVTGVGAATAHPLARATERVVATLVAAEVVRLLVAPDAGRVHRVDLAAGAFTAETARATGICRTCEAPA